MSLLSYIQDTLAASYPHQHKLKLILNTSTPRASHTLFPWSSPHLAVYVQDLLLIILDAASSLPVFGLEASLYTIPSTKTSLLYISKADTTGLEPPGTKRGPLASVASQAFLAWFLKHPPPGIESFRIHVFARAQSQYLFPDSAGNKAKKILTDKQLSAWWRSTLSKASDMAAVPVSKCYLLAGYNELEAIPHLPRAPAEDKWVYGHPYPADKCIADLIPCFSDDPKSRYMTSLTSSPVPAAGESEDYDFQHAALKHLTGETPAGVANKERRLKEMEEQQLRERKRLEGVNINGFWEGMGWRQECCAGEVVGFFVLSRHIEGITEETTTKLLRNYLKGGLPSAIHNRIFTQVHNIVYSETPSDEIAEPHAHISRLVNRWLSDTENVHLLGDASIKKEIYDDCVYREVDLPGVQNADTNGKRKVEEEKPKVMLVARKKAKKV